MKKEVVSVSHAHSIFHTKGLGMKTYTKIELKEIFKMDGFKVELSKEIL